MIQAAIPDVLKNVPESYIRQTMEVFESNANICYSKLKGAPGLNPIRPSGAMYIMVSIFKGSKVLVQIARHAPEISCRPPFRTQGIEKVLGLASLPRQSSFVNVQNLITVSSIIDVSYKECIVQM